MRMMMKVTVPVEAGNKGISEGTLPRTIMAFMEQHKPESAYFFPEGGKRTALFVLDVKDNASIPSIAEPFFLNLNAAVDCIPVMNADELRQGLERIKR